jgi:hypothetical protein
MAWKLKKEWEGKSIDSLNIPLDDLSQKQIAGLNESVRDALFVIEQPKKKKKYDTSN